MDIDDDLSPRPKVGRPPKYDWSDKRNICYKLYVEEQKSATEITKYFAQHFDVDPSELPCRRGFLRQFQLWGFPSHSKSISEEDEATILARIKELWAQNVTQKDIKSTLNEEGWDLKDYLFNKLWKKNGLRLRNAKGYQAPDSAQKKRKRSENPQQGGDVTNDTNADEPGDEDDDSLGAMAPPLGPDEAALRAQRLLEIQLESDQKLQTRKRRRRIRGYGHLPPDAPGTAPRYASETSLDECKAYLHLSNEMYATVRKDYAAICDDMGIVKKTQCAEGVWEQSKERLIRDNLHLSAMMHPLQPDQDKKAIALDCLCCDVTKRLRMAGKAITVAGANNLLGLNPTASKEVRRSFYEILAKDNFDSRLVCGEDHWQELRQQWFDANETLRAAVAENDQNKLKAIDLLCSDAMKRYREDRTKRGERTIVQRNAKYGPGPGPAWAPAPRSKTAKEAGSAMEIREPRVRAIMENTQYPSQENGNLISTLAQATGNIDFLDPALSAGPFTMPQPSAAQPIPAYFRLAQGSSIVGHHPKMWLGKLNSISMAGLFQAATSKMGAAVVRKVHGVMKNDDGTEDSWLIESQDELEVYLGEAGEKASFYVLLEGGYA